MLTPGLVKQVADELGTDPSLIEKDWHVVRSISVLAALDNGDIRPVFSGGTSLSIGWGLIKRFSEDADFKIAMPVAPTKAADRNARRNFREKFLNALAASDFQPIGEPAVKNEGRFFAADFAYPSRFETRPGLRPHLRMEMTFQAPALPPISHPIQSLLARVQRLEPEVPAFLCVDPIETAADKLSALAWRVCARERGAKDDDPTIIRHLHDLAALERHALEAPSFATVLHQSITVDANRGGGRVPRDPAERFMRMLELLRTDPLWVADYDSFVSGVSFAPSNEAISFTAAIEALHRYVEWFQKTDATGSLRNS